MSEAIISVKDLRVQYGDFVLFDDLEFQVNKKDIFIIMGASGCGKSSLLKVLTGLVKPIKGEILINGLTLNDKENPKVNEEIMKTSGVLYQSGALFSSMSLKENVMLPLEIYSNYSKKRN